MPIHYLSPLPLFLALNEGLLDYPPAALRSNRFVAGHSHRYVRSFIGGRVTTGLPLDLDGRPIRSLPLPPPWLNLRKIVEVSTCGIFSNLKQLIVITNQRPVRPRWRYLTLLSIAVMH